MLQHYGAYCWDAFRNGAHFYLEEPMNNSVKKELKVWYIVLISIIGALLVHDAIVMFINIYLGGLTAKQLAALSTRVWYMGFVNYYVNYNMIKTLLFGVPILLLIITVHKLHIADCIISDITTDRATNPVIDELPNGEIDSYEQNDDRWS